MEIQTIVVSWLQTHIRTHLANKNTHQWRAQNLNDGLLERKLQPGQNAPA
jgi:hypothetical protein